MAKRKPRSSRGFFSSNRSITSVADFSVSLLAVLAGILRMLLGVGRMFLALYVVVFSVMFGRSAMGFGGILVMFGCLIVGVFQA